MPTEPDCIHEPGGTCCVCGGHLHKDELIDCDHCGGRVCAPDTYPAGKNCSIKTRAESALCSDCAACIHYHSKLRGDLCCAPNERVECPCDGAAAICPCGDAEV